MANEHGDEQFATDLLDTVPAAPPQLLHAIYLEAFSRYNRWLETHSPDSKTSLSTFVVIHHSQTWFVRGVWGEDSTLDDGQLPAWIYHANRLLQIKASDLGLADQYVESALLSVLSRHGPEGTIGFINRAWIQKMILCVDQAWSRWWLLSRCVAFGIDYQESTEEYDEAETAAGSSGSSRGRRSVSVHEVARQLGRINQAKGRHCDQLIKYYWVVRRTSELNLAEVRRAETYSSWMTGIRNLLPSYLMLRAVAEEASFCARREEDRLNLTPLGRFASERAADIGTSLAQPIFGAVYCTITGEDLRSRTRAAKFLNMGRAILPNFVYENLIDMLKLNRDDLGCLEKLIKDSIRPGHKWFLDRFESTRGEFLGQPARNGRDKTTPPHDG